MNIIVIGDIHNHSVEAEEIASLYEKTHKIIFVGDYFDDFGDTDADAERTAVWLKRSINRPNRIHLMGNHDINYSYLNYKKDFNDNLQLIYSCSGYDLKKDRAINRAMTVSDWDKIKFAHFENGFWFSHGGLHPHWFEHPIRGMSNEHILERLERINYNYSNRTWDEILGAIGFCRGGKERVGGILWLDDDKETQLVSGFKQVYGHTPTMDRIRIWGDPNIKNAVNINVDCGLTQVLEISRNGTYKTIETGFPNFYIKS